MSERRMFAKTIIDSDAFLDMPLSTQALYFHLSMRADDEGFINNPKKIQRMIGATDDDLKLLIAKKFVISFDTGIIVIKHWKIHNYIRADRITETKYTREREMLEVKDNGAYTISDEIKEIEKLDSSDKRKLAYKNSTLPYSFSYKIKRAFEGHACPVCNRIMNSAYKSTMPTIQHNIPITKGGLHELDNISIICESCNTSIKDKETESFNNAKVIEVWDKIIYAEKHKIQWFDNPSLLENINAGQMADICQTDDGQMTDICQQNVRIGKDSIDKDSIGKDSIEYIPTTKLSRASKSTYGDYKNVRLKDDEYQKLVNDFGESKTKECIAYLDEYIEMKGYKAKSHYLCIRKWVVDAVNEHGKKSSIKPNSFNDISSLRKDSEGFDNIVALIEGGGA